MANWHSWVFSNSSRWLGVITFSTMSRDCCGVRAFCVIGAMLPCTFMEGGMPAVMKRSDAFLCTISFRKEVKSTALMLFSRGLQALGTRHRMRCSAYKSCDLCCNFPAVHTAGRAGHMAAAASFEGFLGLGIADGLGARDEAALDQVQQAQVQGLHAERGAGLDRGIHLRHLVLADQVADRRDADHDLVGRDTTAAHLLRQRRRCGG